MAAVPLAFLYGTLLSNLVRHALKHPFQEYTIASYRKSHNVVYQTARIDLLDLSSRGGLEQKKRGKKMVFVVPRNLAERLRKMETESY